jgi:diguanylate cyclase (GGDEF)-like protein/PAS domain S-box-containing protein
MADPSAAPDALRTAFDTITDLAAVLGADGTLVYLNPHGGALLGLDPDAVVGSSFAEFLHPDDLERALVAISHATDEGPDLPVTPALYRLLRSDGSSCRVELNATQTNAGGVDHLVVIGRYSGDHDLQDQVMDLLTQGAPADEAIALVPEFGRWRHPGTQYAVFFVDDDGERRACGSPPLVELGGLERLDSPWPAIAARGEPGLFAIDELEDGFGDEARRRGFTHLWGIPVADPLYGSHAVVAFARRTGGSPPPVHHYALEVMAKVLRLILLWRHQVIGLRRAARLDPLTGAANRAGFWDALQAIEAGAPAGRDDEVLAVLYIDLDGFKDINDRYGHTVGDQVLADVADRLAQLVRPGDLVARLGGDEFAVVARDLEDVERAGAIAERIVAALGQPLLIGGHRVELGASVGVAPVARTTGFDADRLLDEADRALYRAKSDGRGRWRRAAVGS